MTFCVGMRLKEGIIGLADNLIITGNEAIRAKKITTHRTGNNSFFLMTSGLRSARDKTITYLDEALERHEESLDRLYKAVNLFSNELRRVKKEDGEALSESGFTFNIYSIVGGQFENDPEPQLFLVYPQGNWINVGTTSPYVIIGESKYGKPIIKRTLTYDTSLHTALRIAYLAFDSSRINAIDVDFPIDIAVYRNNSFCLEQYRFTENELADISEWWQERLRKSAEEMPAEWVKKVLNGNPESAA
ncbi:MAG: peptidase [Candidatus Dadabacteria bacterium]|nr:peptidase [Candidatus Dadabacteria bacterium]MCY4262452.1 peptidase [Candidatus Dadabacteria bacterium]